MRSMTGYGKGKGEWNGFTFYVDIRSLNSRFIEIQCKLPVILQGFEYDFRKMLTERLLRGKIFFSIATEPEEEVLKTIRISSEVLAGYHNQIRDVAKDLHLSSELRVVDLLNLPGVIESRNPEHKIEEIYAVILPIVEEALDDLLQMQKNEFGFIRQKLLEFLDKCSLLVTSIEKENANNVKRRFDLFRERVSSLLKDTEIPEERLYTEMALMADKLDITEETDRLRSHLNQFKKILNEDTPGKKLNFLLQEMNRETNTIGSKSGNSDISYHVVELKDLIEKMREQVQNII